MSNNKSKPEPHRYSILFVDDEEMARHYFKRMCKPEFEVITAEDAYKAMELLDNYHDKIAVLITDQRMPGMTGTQLLEVTMKRFPKIVRLLTTAYMDVDDNIDLVIQGEILNKPWNAEKLKSALSGAMQIFNEQK